MSHARRFGPHAVGVFFRQEAKQLEEVIARSSQLYPRMGARFVGGNVLEWRFPNGARLKFRDLSDKNSAKKYQGHAYTRLYFEELTQWAEPEPIDLLMATLRSAEGVPVGMRSTCNPGGPGHNWVKARYIDPNPAGYTVIKDRGIERIFIPAKLSDNKLLTGHDPAYESRLKASGSEALVRAWLDGDWNIIDGAFFDCWRSSVHVIEPFKIPKEWVRFRSFDWGSASPFSVGWWAISDGSIPQYPRGALIRFREWYGALGPNKGLKLTAERVAEGILAREPQGEKISHGVADPSIFIQNGGPSIADRMGKLGIRWRKGDNKRIAGWDQMRDRLLGHERPMIFCFNTCIDSIRTIPVLEHDQDQAEDLDTSAEDHAADEWRYACMSRPWNRPIRAKKKKKDPWDEAFSNRKEEVSSWIVRPTT